jgi:transcriptional regulator of arginine metabolism
VRDRLNVLRDLLSNDDLSTQDELREKLQKLDFDVTQSTISRDLRKLGAVRTLDEKGRSVYRLLEKEFEPPTTNMRNMIRGIRANAALIIIQTTPGTAPIVARHLDIHCSEATLGTIAGDDTVFVAMAPDCKPQQTILDIEASFVTTA